MLLEATVIPLTTLPTAHPSPEAVRPLPALPVRDQHHRAVSATVR
jgi:hypothetical protein